MKPTEGTIKLGCCPHTMQSTLQVYTQGEWLCLHRDTRQEEIDEIQEYLKTNK